MLKGFSRLGTDLDQIWYEITSIIGTLFPIKIRVGCENVHVRVSSSAEDMTSDTIGSRPLCVLGNLTLFINITMLTGFSRLETDLDRIWYEVTSIIGA